MYIVNSDLRSTEQGIHGLRAIKLHLLNIDSQPLDHNPFGHHIPDVQQHITNVRYSS